MEINLGGSIPDYYSTKESLSISSAVNTITYSMKSFEFGIVYTENSVVTS